MATDPLAIEDTILISSSEMLTFLAAAEKRSEAERPEIPYRLCIRERDGHAYIGVIGGEKRPHGLVPINESSVAEAGQAERQTRDMGAVLVKLLDDL